VHAWVDVGSPLFLWFILWMRRKKTLIEESVDVIRRRESERKERKLVAFFEESADFTCQFYAFKNHVWFTLIKLLVTMNQLTFFCLFWTIRDDTGHACLKRIYQGTVTVIFIVKNLITFLCSAFLSHPFIVKSYSINATITMPAFLITCICWSCQMKTFTLIYLFN